ncbi:hypothetical protein MMC20_002918 [Loxospora ochrophaea]|nr:hypothetical protein [Loxospora ochrophaea]
MASADDPTMPPPPVSSPDQQPQNGGIFARGGRNNRGGRRNGALQELHGNDSGEGTRGARRGNRRGQRGPYQGRHTERAMNAATHSTPFDQAPPSLGSIGIPSARLASDLKNTADERAAGEQPVENEVEAEVCFICASPVVHNSVAPCNHRTCHICALRLRALYKSRACAHCRTEAQYVIFTDDPNKRYESFVQADFEQTDEVLGIKYERKDIHDDTVLLLRYNCPDGDCDVACWGWPDLHRHVKSVHHKFMCDLCTRNKKVFTHEHELFTIQELRKHEKFGDDNPGAIDQSGFKGHPECGFCRLRFYGDDELYTHCRDKHERCHICDRRSQGSEQQYFADYNNLELHFRRDHFLCAENECMEKKFVVFESEMDLKAHQLETHPNGLSKDARKDARRVDISAFDYRTPHQDNRGNRREREGRGRGRGRDPNTEALPQSSAQPLRRDERAYQRQMEIQSAQSFSTRTFGGQLTSTDAYAAQPNRRSQEPATVTAPRSLTGTNTSFPPIDNLNLDSAPPLSNQTQLPPPQQTLTPQEQARRLRHNAVAERASSLLHNDSMKTSEFRTKVSSYRNSTISASQLIDTFFSLFDAPAAELGKLIKELAEIYENESKRNELLKAWNDWRAINEDYPSLPGPSGILPGSSASAAGSGGRRVLRLKSSTAQSSRSAVSKHRSWGGAVNANPFPAMPPSSTNRTGAGKVGATPWVTSSSSRVLPVPPMPASTSSKPRSTTPNSDAFPALPAAPKPNTTIFGLHHGAVKWDDRRNPYPAANPWSTSEASSAKPSATSSETEVEVDASGGKKRGGKGKKQTLYKFG